MRRRRGPVLLEPPARLRTFTPTEWLEDVDRGAWDGFLPFRAWELDEAWQAWTEARLQWRVRHGWPGGADDLALIVEGNAQLEAAHRALRGEGVRGA